MPSAPRPAPGLARDLQLLEALGGDEALRRGGLGVVRLAEQTGRDKSQVSRALRALEREGLVERDAATREFRLGWRLFALAARSGEGRLLQVAGPLLRRLAGELGAAAHLCVLRTGEVLTLLSEPGGHGLRGGWEGFTVPTTCTSAGRVLLMDDTLADLRRRLGDRPFPGPRLRVRTVADLYAEILAIRRRGFATVDEEFEAGLVGASAPVRDLYGRVVAAVNVSAAKGRHPLDALGRLTAEAAAELTAAVGGRARAGRGAALT